MKTQLITRGGYEKLKQELDYLWREERPEVTKPASVTAAKTQTINITKSAYAKSIVESAISPNALSNCVSLIIHRSRMERSSSVHG